MHQRTRPVRLVSLALGMAVALVGVAPASTSVTQAQEPRTYVHEYRGSLPAASVQALGETYLDTSSGAITPVSGTIEILVEETEQDLEETEHVDYIMTRFEARVEVFGELNTLLSPAHSGPAGGEMTRNCALGHWTWVSEYVADYRLTDDGHGVRLQMGGTATDAGVGPDCTHFVPLVGGSPVYFRLYRGNAEGAFVACTFIGGDREECLANGVQLDLYSEAATGTPTP